MVSVLLFAGLAVLRAEGGEAPRPTDLGYEALSKGDWDTALARFDEAIRAEPRNAVAYQGRGVTYGMRGDLDLAIVELTKAMQLDPTDATAYRNRGAAYLFKGDYDRAIADCDEAIRRNLRDSTTYNNRGFAYLRKGNVEKAISDLTEAIRLDPKERAIAARDEAIRIDRKNRAALRARSGVYWKKGEWDKALADINEAIRLDPKSSETYIQRASIYMLKGESNRALADFTEAIRLDPKSADAYVGRGGCLARQHQYDKAITDVCEAIRLSPKSPCFYEGRGMMWINCDDYERGIADIETAIRLNPADPAATYEAWPKGTITSTALQHGERQLRQMLHDRPAMRTYGEKAGVLYEWAGRKFAGEDFGRKIFWDVSEPPPHTTGANYASWTEGPGFIQVGEKYINGPDKGKERSFEKLWRDAVFELYNITNSEDFRRITMEVFRGRLSKEEFVAKIIECESRAAEKTRAFYIHVFMPWAKQHGVSTHPQLWYLAQRSDPSENLFRLVTEKTPYWRACERRYDLIVLDSLTRQGENWKAIGLAAEMRKQAETPQERAAICRYSGYCFLQLNMPFSAIDAYNEVIRFDPKDADAYLGRAGAYARLHDMDHAMADYSEAIRLKPSNPEAYLLRGKAYESMGDKERANADFAMAKQLTELRGVLPGNLVRGKGDGLMSGDEENAQSVVNEHHSTPSSLRSRAGFRRHCRQSRSIGPARRAWIGRSSKKHSRSRVVKELERR